jgi:hypothetical protein
LKILKKRIIVKTGIFWEEKMKVKIWIRSPENLKIFILKKMLLYYLYQMN